MVTRIMARYYKMDQDADFPAVKFDCYTEDMYYKGKEVNEHVNIKGNHSVMIHEISTASTVLLKNINSGEHTTHSYS